MNIVYLFGAGASCNALPMVNNFNERLIAFQNFLTHQLNRNYFDKIVGDGIEIFKWIPELIESRLSPDDFAKRLYNRYEMKEFEQFKLLLASFIIYEQLDKSFYSSAFFSNEYDNSVIPPLFLPVSDDMQLNIRRCLDKRYVEFWNRICQNRLELPINCKYLTYNYDNQLELSFADSFNREIRDAIRLLKKYKFTDDEISFTYSLNGTCSDLMVKNEKLVTSFYANDKKLKIDMLQYFLKLTFDKMFSRDNHLFYYSWEKNNYKNQMISSIQKNVIQDCDLLIVIGYSFPDYNFDNDDEIFSQLKADSKIVYQIPNINEPQCQELERLREIVSDEIEVIGKSNCDSFYVPKSKFKYS